MIKIGVVKRQMGNEKRFFLEYIFYLSGGRMEKIPVKTKPRGWKTLKGALRVAERIGYEVENADEFQ